MKIAAVAAAALALSGAAASSAHAQFANMDINALNAQMNARMNTQMNGITNNIVSSNMQNPAVIAAYRANPRGMSFQQFAYNYAATAGFTPQGMAYYNASEANNRAREQAALADYRGAQQNFANAIAARNASAFQHGQDIGADLRGQQYYMGPQGPIALSYMPGATPWTQGGYTYRQVNNGNNYVASGPGGSWLISPR